ncbi:MAG: hypothetical protein QG604_833 [Candidatus Dependentiae bacterium]|nr:hypothetical protein [Candidatus Dependentiae bacterium]
MKFSGGMYYMKNVYISLILTITLFYAPCQADVVDWAIPASAAGLLVATLPAYQNFKYAEEESIANPNDVATTRAFKRAQRIFRILLATGGTAAVIAALHHAHRRQTTQVIMPKDLTPKRIKLATPKKKPAETPKPAPTEDRDDASEVEDSTEDAAEDRDASAEETGD